MKKIFLFSLIFLFSISLIHAKDIDNLYYGVKAYCDKLFVKKAYTSCFNYTTKNPDWVTYTITNEMAAGYHKRPKNFYEDKDVPKEYRATLKDYKGSGYDRGHLMPNAMSDYSKETQKESFLLSNIVPELPFHNRTIWKKLEEEIRNLIKKEKEFVIFTGVIYETDYKTIGNKVAIPSYFYKVILAPYSSKTFAFIIPHKSYKNNYNIKDYQTTVDNIEDLTGIDFFSNLSKEVQENIENKKFEF
jgi:endonuclease G